MSSLLNKITENLETYSINDLSILMKQYKVNTIEDISKSIYNQYYNDKKAFMNNEQGEQKLIDAIASKNLDMVKKLVEDGVDVNIQYNDGQTPLFNSIVNIDSDSDISDIYRDLDIIQYLVENGANVNIQNNDGQTPLFPAINSDSGLDIIKYLVENGADINIQDNKGETPLFSAINSGSGLYIIKYLVENGADINIQDNDGQTPLFPAINSDSGIVKYLVENGADINIQDNKGETVFFNTIKKSYTNVELLEYLVENGANVNIQNNDGRTPLFKAVIFGVVNSDLDIVKYLVENGANVNMQDNDGHTPLFFSIAKIADDQQISIRLDVIKYLLENGADVNIQAKDGKTVLTWVSERNDKLFKYLVDNKLKNIEYPKDWYKRCSDNIDIISQETWEDLTNDPENGIKDPITIDFGARVECGERVDFIDIFKKSPQLTIWYIKPSLILNNFKEGKSECDKNTIGHGMAPIEGAPIFVKLTPYHYVIKDIRLLLSKKRDFKATLVNKNKFSYGNIKGTFGVSESHGQEEAIIYKLE